VGHARQSGKRTRHTGGPGSVYSMQSHDTAIMIDDGDVSTLREQRDIYDSQSGFSAIEENLEWEQASTAGPSDEVLLNISPNKFEKPKDQLFIDFFSMYTKKFVDEQSSSKVADSKDAV
jgi:hypothetical protein